MKHPFLLIGLAVSALILAALRPDLTPLPVPPDPEPEPIEDDEPVDPIALIEVMLGELEPPPAEVEEPDVAPEPEPELEPRPAPAPTPQPEPEVAVESPPPTPAPDPIAEASGPAEDDESGSFAPDVEGEAPRHPRVVVSSTWDEVLAFVRATGSMIAVFDVEADAFRARLDPTRGTRMPYRAMPGFSSTAIELSGFRAAELREGEIALLLLPRTLFERLRHDQGEACRIAGLDVGPDVTTRVGLLEDPRRPFAVAVVH